MDDIHIFRIYTVDLCYNALHYTLLHNNFKRKTDKKISCVKYENRRK